MVRVLVVDDQELIRAGPAALIRATPGFAGAGAPGGGNNDDYAVVHDYCGDGHGVLIGSKDNGNGLAKEPVVWDPFRAYGNVYAGDAVGLKVCLVDGNGDTTPAKCASKTHTSVDG
ncbi:hypothetical protein [Amycolatopsis sp. NPDC003861]